MTEEDTFVLYASIGRTLKYYKVVRRELYGRNEERFIMHPEHINADLLVAMLPTHKQLPVAINIQITRFYLPNLFHIRLKDGRTNIERTIGYSTKHIRRNTTGK